MNPTDETGDGGKVGPNIYESTKQQLLDPTSAVVGSSSHFKEIGGDRTSMSI